MVLKIVWQCTLIICLSEHTVIILLDNYINVNECSPKDMH